MSEQEENVFLTLEEEKEQEKEVMRRLKEVKKQLSLEEQSQLMWMGEYLNKGLRLYSPRMQQAKQALGLTN